MLGGRFGGKGNRKDSSRNSNGINRVSVHTLGEQKKSNLNKGSLEDRKVET